MNRAIQTTGSWTGTRFAHEAFLFDDDAALRNRCVPFVEQGLDRGEAVVVVASEEVRALLEEVLGPRTADLEVFAPAESFWRGGHETLSTYNDSMRPLLASGRPWRLIGEPVWLATPGGEVWSRFEAVANEAFADYPYYSLCLHDRRRLPPALIEAQLRTHPLTWDGAKPVPSPLYEPTDTFLRSVEPQWSPAPPDRWSVRVTVAREARSAIRVELARTGQTQRSAEILLALHELVSNAVRAAGSAEVSHWLEGDRMVWEVADSGPGMHDVTAGYVPPSDDLDSGRGLWLARSLADEATVRGHGTGTAVRLMFSA